MDWILTGIGDPKEKSIQLAPKEDGYFHLPHYSVEASAGNGSLIEAENIDQHLAFRESWVKRLGLKPENLIAIYARGDSMEPTIFSGDTLVIDKSMNTVTSDGRTLFGHNDAHWYEMKLDGVHLESWTKIDAKPQFQKFFALNEDPEWDAVVDRYEYLSEVGRKAQAMYAIRSPEGSEEVEFQLIKGSIEESRWRIAYWHRGKPFWIGQSDEKRFVSRLDREKLEVVRWEVPVMADADSLRFASNGTDIFQFEWKEVEGEFLTYDLFVRKVTEVTNEEWDAIR